MKTLPQKFAWLDDFKAPKVWLEARRHYGLMEVIGVGNNLDIMNWCKETNQQGVYTADAVPWCGLFVGVVVQRSGYAIPKVAVRAKEWLNWGRVVPNREAAFMDVLIFQRPGGGHVGFYVGENDENYLVYGGNQSDAVGFAWIAKNRCVGVRRCIWKIAQPVEVKKIHLTFNGQPSINEA